MSSATRIGNNPLMNARREHDERGQHQSPNSRMREGKFPAVRIWVAQKGLATSKGIAARGSRRFRDGGLRLAPSKTRRAPHADEHD